MKESSTANESQGAQDNPGLIRQEIQNWNDLSQNNVQHYVNDVVAMVKSALQGLGWCFFPDPNLFVNSKKLHVYVGLRASDAKLSVFIIDAKDDIKGPDVFGKMTRVDLTNVTDPYGSKFSIPDPNDTSHRVRIASAVTRVYRWGTDWIRNAWIDHTVKNPPSNQLNTNILFSAIVIDTSDFNVLPTANYFACFLCLQESIKNNKMTFTPDIIVVDTDANKQTKSLNYMVEDVVHSIPPCSFTDAGSASYYQNFGGLLELGLITVP